MGTELPPRYESDGHVNRPAIGTAPSLLLSSNDDYESTVRAHAQYFSDLSGTAGERLNGSGIPDGGRGQLQALRLIRSEEENILEALDTALRRRQLEWLLVISSNYCNYLLHQGASLKVVSRCMPLLELARECGDPRLTMSLELGVCRSLWQVGQLEEARSLLDDGLRLARELGDMEHEARALNSLGVLEHLQGNYDVSEDFHRQAIDVCRACHDTAGEAAALTNLGIVHFLRGEYAKARPVIEQGLKIRVALGNLHGEANSLANLGIVDLAEKKHAAARAHFQNAHRIHLTIGDRRGQCMTGSNLGILEHQLGNLDDAERQHYHCLDLCAELGDRDTAAYLYADLGIIAGKRGDHIGAARLHTLALASRLDLNDKIGIITSCGLVGSTLVQLGQLEAAAITLHCAKHQFESGKVDLESTVGAQMQLGFELLAVADVPSANLEEWAAAARRLTVEELGKHTLGTLQAISAQSN